MRRSRGRNVPFVGRAEELDALRDASEVAADGDLVLVLVDGDAGMGKTALVEAFAEELAAESVPVHWGRCADIGGAPAFWPWLQVLRSIGDDAVALAEERFAARPDEPFVAFDTVHEILRARRHQLRVVVLDDLHAADLPSLELLRFLGRTAADIPLLVIGTHRASELRLDPDRDVLLAEIGASSRRVSPAPLGLSEVRALLHGLVEDDDLGDVAASLLARSEGNALYVEQLVDAVSRSGPEVLAQIPAGIRAAVRSRLQPLPPLAVELLSAASILAPPIRPPVLAAMAHRSVEEVEDALGTAVMAGILAEGPSGVAFDHALVRDAVAHQLAPGERRRLHASAAEAFAAGAAGRTAPAAVVAQHLLDAEDLAAPHVVARWAEAAADEARRVGAPGEVARWLEIAADGWDEAGDATREGAALRDATRARAMGGDALGAIALNDQLLHLARRSGSGLLLADAALSRAELFAPTQRFDGPPLIQEALAHPDLADEPARRAELLGMLAGVLGMPSVEGPRFDGDGARAALAELEELVATRVPEMQATLADARLSVDSGPARHRDRIRWLGQLDGSPPPGPSVFQRLTRAYWATSLAFEEGDLHAVELRLREWESLAERADSSFWRWRAASARATLVYARGRLAEAEQLAMAAQPHVATLNPEMGFRVLAGLVFTIRRDQGRLHELAAFGADAFGVLGALVAAELGDLVDARRRLDQLDHLAEATDPDDLYWLCLKSVLVYGAEAVGDVDRCRRLVTELEPFADQFVMWGRSYVFGSPVAEMLGVAHRGAGDLELAAASFRRARAWADAAGAPGFGVRADAGLCSVLAPDDPERASLLVEARRAAESLGFGAVAAELAALGGPASGTPSSATGAGPSDTPVASARARRPGSAGIAHPRVRTLGRFEVLAPGAAEPSRWSSRKARDALKVLIARRGRAIPREELIELLWPDVDLATARNRLSVVLSMVRNALDPDRRLDSDVLVADRQAVALDLGLVAVDVDAFFTAAGAALAAIERGAPDTAALVADALDLADRGPFLAEDPYADWSTVTRAAVERTHRQLLRAMARATEGVHPDEAVGWWARLVEVDPDDDAALGSLVALLERAGRHGEAAVHRESAARRRRSLGLGPLT